MSGKPNALESGRMDNTDIGIDSGIVVKLGKYKKITVSKKIHDDDKCMEEKRKETELIDAIITDSKIDIAAKTIEKAAMQMVEEFVNRLGQQGLSIEQYYSISGLNMEQLLKQMMPVAERRVKGRLVLESVAKAEHLEATEEEYRTEIDKLSARYLMEADAIKDFIAGKEEKQVKADIAIQKALHFIMNSSVEKE